MLIFRNLSKKKKTGTTTLRRIHTLWTFTRSVFFCRGDLTYGYLRVCVGTLRHLFVTGDHSCGLLTSTAAGPIARAATRLLYSRSPQPLLRARLARPVATSAFVRRAATAAATLPRSLSWYCVACCQHHASNDTRMTRPRYGYSAAHQRIPGQTLRVRLHSAAHHPVARPILPFGGARMPCLLARANHLSFCVLFRHLVAFFAASRTLDILRITFVRFITELILHSCCSSGTGFYTL